MKIHSRSVTLDAGAKTIADVITLSENKSDDIEGSFTVTVLEDINTHSIPHYAISADANLRSVNVPVVDDDSAPIIQIAAASNEAISEGDNAIMFSIDQTATDTALSSGRDIEIQVTITETAGEFFGIEVDPAAPTDPKTKTETVTLKAGETSVVGIVPIDDTIDEVNGTFSVALVANTDNAEHYSLPETNPPVAISVNDDDDAPVIHPVIKTYREGDTAISFRTYTDEFGTITTTASDKEIKFSVTIEETDPTTVTYDYFENNDVAAAIVATLPALAEETTIPLTITDDTFDEINGVFKVTIAADDDDEDTSPGAICT